MEQLYQLAELRNEGFLEDHEFESRRIQILNEITRTHFHPDMLIGQMSQYMEAPRQPPAFGNSEYAGKHSAIHWF